MSDLVMFASVEMLLLLLWLSEYNKYTTQIDHCNDLTISQWKILPPLLSQFHQLG